MWISYLWGVVLPPPPPPSPTLASRVCNTQSLASWHKQLEAPSSRCVPACASPCERVKTGQPIGRRRFAAAAAAAPKHSGGGGAAAGVSADFQQAQTNESPGKL